MDHFETILTLIEGSLWWGALIIFLLFAKKRWRKATTLTAEEKEHVRKAAAARFADPLAGNTGWAPIHLWALKGMDDGRGKSGIRPCRRSELR